MARYPRARRWLHWTIAWTVTVQFALMLVLHQLQSLAFAEFVLGLHRQLGTITLLLIVATLVLRRRLSAPASPAGLPTWQARIALVGHLLMLATLMAIPMLGLIIAWSRGDDVMFLGLISIPPLVELTNVQAAMVEQAHRWLAYGLLVLIAGHLAAVALNHLWRRIPVTERMLAPPPRQLVNRVPIFAQLTLVCGAILASTVAAGLYGAHRYTAFNLLRASFDEVDVARVDQLRALQLRAHGLLNKQPNGTANDAVAVARGLRAIANDEGPQPTGALRAAAMSFERIATDGSYASPARGVALLDELVEGEAMHLFEMRLDIAQHAAEGHDLIILALAPTAIIGAILAFFLSRNILVALAHARRAVHEIGEGRPRRELAIIGGGELAVLARDIIDMRDYVLARERTRYIDDQERTRRNEEARRLAGARERAHEMRQAELARSADTARAFIVEELARALAALAKGDLTVRLDRPFIGPADSIRHDFNTAATELEAAMQLIAASSQMIDADAQEVTLAAGELAARTAQQAKSLTSSASAVACIAQDLERSSADARETAKRIASARAEADLSCRIVGDAARAMSDIERSSEKISGITRVIDQIARQTGMLALNARIEAARAGSSGSGFAVIAQEVRSLANRAAAATREIDAVIMLSSAHVASGVGLVQQASEALQKIIGEVHAVDGLVAQIAASVETQSADIAHINIAMGEIDHVVRDNAEMADQTVAALRHMATNAGALDRLIRRFAVGNRHEPVAARVKRSWNHMRALQKELVR